MQIYFLFAIFLERRKYIFMFLSVCLTQFWLPEQRAFLNNLELFLIFYVGSKYF